jgi:glycerol 3-phosphatase-2
VIFALDLDGVIWLAGEPIPGSAGAVARLRQLGHQPLFVTNNSGPTLGEYASSLARAGVQASAREIVTSAEAAASLIAPGERVAALGGPGLFEALAARRATIVGPGDRPDAVVMGRTTTIDYDQLAVLCDAVRAGARFVATNHDATFPVPGGLLPGAGALVAFVEVASGVRAEVAGKPHQPAASLTESRYGRVDVMVGDRPDTDGAFARVLGARFALVLTGVTKRGDLPTDPEPDEVAEDLGELIDGLA